MTREELSRRQDRAARETLVIQKTAEGHRVYPPGDPARNYLVSGSVDAPTCTCPDFEHNRHDPEWRCKHILAIPAYRDRNPVTPGPSSPSVAGQRAPAPADAGARDIPDPPSRTSIVASNGGAHMLLKRSVSPDGRIDSLSVEFTCPVDGSPAPDIDTRAARILHLQDGIVARFLKNGSGHNGNRRVAPENRPTNGSDHAVPAVMIGIAGGNTKWGRRLYIDCQVDGKTLRLYGNDKQLAEFIERAGFPNRIGRIEEGMRLNLPCQVSTKRSVDGRYVNVDQVYPAEPRNARPGSNR